MVHHLYQHEELPYSFVYVATVPGNNTYLVFLLQEKSGLLNEISLSLKPDTIESLTIRRVLFFHTSELEMEVNQFGSLFPRVCSGTRILFVSKFSQSLFWKSLTLVISVLRSCMTFSRELLLKTSSDELSVFEIARSVFFVLQFTIKSVSLTLVLNSCMSNLEGNLISSRNSLFAVLKNSSFAVFAIYST